MSSGGCPLARRRASGGLRLKGGTALAAAYGLTRPSMDLDLDVARRVDVVERVGRTLAQRKDLEVERLDVKQHGRGYVRLWFRHAGFAEPFRAKIDVNVRDGIRKPRLDQDRIVMVDGLAVYDMPTLASLKLNALVGDDRRVQARDLYDAAWLTAKHGDAITLDNKVRLHDWTLNFDGEQERAWRETFEADETLAWPRCDFDDVLLALMANLEADAELQSHLKCLRGAPPASGAMRP